MFYNSREICEFLAMGKRKGGDWVEVGKGGEMGTSVIMSTIKIKQNKRNL